MNLGSLFDYFNEGQLGSALTLFQIVSCMKPKPRLVKK
jgi:hypothetical protein